MAKDPAVLFYTSDFLSGVMDLDMEERGQYITLLCAQHQKGHLSAKTIRLLVGSASVSVLDKFKQDADGNYFNERMDNEIGKRLTFIDSRVENGKKGGRPKKPNKNLMVNHMHNHMPNLPENDNGNENINDNVDENEKSNITIFPSFDDFWNLYAKKIDRPRCIKRWESVKQSEREEIMDYLPHYIASTPDLKFRKNPLTFLNNRGWENEIVDNQKKTKNDPIAYAEWFARNATEKPQ